MIKNRTPARGGFVKFLLLGLLATGGLGLGLYLASDSTPDLSLPATKDAALRFPLSPADAKDTLEAVVTTTDARGRVYVAWASRTGENERTLSLIRSDDQGRTFDSPRVIARSGVFKAVSQMKGKTMTRELRMVPHLAATPTAVHLAWTETLPGNSGVRMVTASSTDRGNSFSTPLPVHQGEGARPTFTALNAAADGLLLASWLDNRNKSQQCYSAIRRVGQIAFELVQVVHSGDDDKGVCPCCPTASLLSPDGTAYVAFRNVANGYRDIAIGVKKPNASTFELHSIVPPTWSFNGCPHDGPSLALVGNMLHVVWMDAHTGSPKCYHASCNVRDMRFTSCDLHDAPTGTQGNAKLHVDAKGTLHAVWEESLGAEPPPEPGHRHEPAIPKPGAGGGRAVMYRSMPPGASQFGEARSVSARPGAFQTRPAITSTPQGDVILAWTELDVDGKSVVITRLGTAGEH